MTMIYLRHPDHGVKVAYLDAEAEMDERNGWERFDFHAERTQTAAASTDEQPKRRGRPPKEKSNAAE